MDKVYNHRNVEEKIYQEWEKNGYFKPEVNPNGKPYCIILPPPNANAPLHFGHAMYVIEDILIRYHRMKGFASLWLPGADHAGFETQYVFEKHLAKEGKSRFDYDRDTLYQMIWDFVQKNKPIMENQLRKLGFSLDWSREKFTLDEDIIQIVYQTFKKLYDDGLVYRGYRLVNYCTKDGTSFSDLEVVYEERKDPLYYIKYGPLTLATVRPETKFGDTGVAVHPKDPRYQQYIGQEIEIETVLGKANIKVVGDEAVEREFGTGVVKVTPAHDFADFEIGQRHNFSLKQVIDFNGRLNDKAGRFAGMRVMQARKAVVEAMKEKGLIEKIDENYTHRIGLCYKCKTVIEPLPMEQWFVKVGLLAEEAIKVVENGAIKIYPKSFEKRYFQFLEHIKDWNISRQIVWGIRIPAWFCGGPKMSSQLKMGFHKDVVPQVFDGKTKTYRLRNHNFKIGDRVVFENTQTKTLFGYGVITDVQETTVDQIDYKDQTHYKVYASLKELMDAFKLRNPDKNVTAKSKAYLYGYEFHTFNKKDAEKGCGQVIISSDRPKTCPACKGHNLIQDTDVFDTWFSSAQWPFATLMSCSKSNIKYQISKMSSQGNTSEVLRSDSSDGERIGGQVKQFSNLFDYFYPTSVMETGYEILPWWVARMIMVGVYVTGKIPFRNVVLHGMVRDPLGQKMSKSKGNVVNPLEIVDKYGADVIRFSLVYGTTLGTDQALSYPKFEAARKFTNKLWNIGRFINMNQESRSGPEALQGRMARIRNQGEKKGSSLSVAKGGTLSTSNLTIKQLTNLAIHPTDKEWIKKVEELTNEITNYLDNYDFNHAAQRLYDFTWHELADKYIEDVKNRIDENSFMILNSLFLILLKLLHPFIPFITEELYRQLGYEGKMLIIEKWPT